jgi:hypothetical protein
LTKPYPGGLRIPHNIEPAPGSNHYSRFDTTCATPPALSIRDFIMEDNVIVGLLNTGSGVFFMVFCIPSMKRKIKMKMTGSAFGFQKRLNRKKIGMPSTSMVPENFFHGLYSP